MKKLIYIILLFSIGANAQFDVFLKASQQQFANESGGFDSGLIINGTFDDSSNITPNSNWTIGSGVASFDGGTGGLWLDFGISAVITPGTAYTLKFTTSNEAGTVRFKMMGYNDGYEYDVELETAGYRTYSNGYNELSFTTDGEGGLGNWTNFIIEPSSTSDAFDIDNISLTAD